MGPVQNPTLSVNSTCVEHRTALKSFAGMGGAERTKRAYPQSSDSRSGDYDLENLQMIGKVDSVAVRQRIGPTVKALRYQQRMSLNTLAEQAGISPSHLSRIERGLTVPSYDVLDHIADALGSDLSALRHEEESALAVDVELDSIFGKIDLGSDARAELLRLSHETRRALARGLRSFAGCESTKTTAS